MVSIKIAVALLGAALVASTVAQEASIADVEAYLAQPDPQGCQLGPDVCSCSLQASAGKCTKPLTSDQTPPGVCEQQECTESYKCDCLGFELCQISTCGQWKPVSPLPEPVPDRFACEYTPNIAKCRNWEDFAADTFGADNGKDQAAEFMVESAAAEEETMAVGNEIAKGKHTVFKALKDADIPKATQEEKEALEADVELYVQAANTCYADLSEVLDTSKAVYENQKKARAEQRAAREAGKLEKAEMEKLKEAEKVKECPSCDELKRKVKEYRQARRAAAIAAGTWSKKARDGKKKCKAAKERARASKLTADELEARCIAKKTAILKKYEAEP